jgi:hypothetical protein
MKSPFSYGSKGIEFNVTLEPHEKRTKHLLTLKTSGFLPTGIRIEGGRLYEVMISNITLGQASLTTTPFALSTVQSFKAYVDGRISGQVMKLGDTLSFELENRGGNKLNIVIYIDGKKVSTK